jgi:hypothetical protein
MELLERLRLEQSAHFVGIHAANMSAACVRKRLSRSRRSPFRVGAA